MCAFPSRGLVLSLCLLSGCGPESPTSISREAYVWKRDWTAATSESVRRCEEILNGIIVLGAEIDRWPVPTTRAVIVRPSWDIDTLKSSKISLGFAIRAPHFAGIFDTGGAEFQTLHKTLVDLVSWVEKTDLPVSEFHIDFDCPSGSLPGYKTWLDALRRELPEGSALTITALPTWLDSPGWNSLATSVDGFVLQVHAVTAGDASEPPAMLCDPAMAFQWAKQANRVGIPFRVALPTYTSVVGYAPSGEFLGIVSDGPEPAWPPGTRTKVFAADPRGMLRLRLSLEHADLANLAGIIWYRAPQEGEARNASWNTLRQMVELTASPPPPVVNLSGETTIDLTLDYSDTLPGPLPRFIRVSWPEDATLIASDAVGTFQCEAHDRFVLFSSTQTAAASSKHGAGAMPLGWLRFDRPHPDLHVQIIE